MHQTITEMTKSNKTLLIKIFVLAGLFLTFLIWLIPAFDISNYQNEIYCLDVLSSYNVQIVSLLFNYLGNDGMGEYRTFLLVDTFYLLIYGGLSFYTLRFLLANIGRLGNILKYLIWLPIVLMLADLTENSLIFVLLYQFSNINENLVQISSAVSTVKWFLAAVVVGSIICLIFYGILRYIFWKLKSQSTNLP